MALLVSVAPLVARSPAADSTHACRTAVYYQRPTALDSAAIFSRDAALWCTGLPPTADTLTILAAVAERGGDRDPIAYYALVVANRHFRASRDAPDRPNLERALRSLRIVHQIQPSCTTASLLGLAAGSLALSLQESDRCVDVTRAVAVFVEARTILPVDSRPAGPDALPDWDDFERKAKERAAHICGLERAQPPVAKPREN